MGRARRRSVLEREARLIEEAIAMVADGGSRRVVVAGLHHGVELLESSCQLALESGVRVVPLRRRDVAGVDISVEPIHV